MRQCKVSLSEARRPLETVVAQLAMARGTPAQSARLVSTKSCSLERQRVCSATPWSVQHCNLSACPYKARNYRSSAFSLYFLRPVKGDPIRPVHSVRHMSARRCFFGRIWWLCETKIESGSQQDIFNNALSDSLSMVTCDGMQGSKYPFGHVMGSEHLSTVLHTAQIG